ncbi:MAG TPA: hypothetical protein VMW63_06880 [Methanoregulaceae archaeon]|nr:hypothetical protein [Methanoregulaceae archaeon]
MKWVAFLLAIALLTGLASADRGIDPTPETLGIVISTTIGASGSIHSNSDISMSITDAEEGLGGIPPLGGSGIDSEYNPVEPFGATLLAKENGATLYNAVYQETTSSNGRGEIQYTKILDVDTSEKTTGQSNIEASKQLTYSGEDMGSVFSEDTIAIDSIATPDPLWWTAIGAFTPAPDRPTGSSRSICGWICAESPVIPGYYNSVDAESAVDMTQVHLTTQSSACFITTSADSPVSLSHDIRVIDSLGVASAGIDVIVMESRPVEDLVSGEVAGVTVNSGESRNDLFEEVSFSESTRVDGIITVFDKSMVYESGMNR